MNQNSIKLFENKKVRIEWDETQQKWYFSIIDVIEILTGSSIPRRYWSDLKIKLKEEGFELYDFLVQLKFFGLHLWYKNSESVTNCNQLKLQTVTNCNALNTTFLKIAKVIP